MNQTYQEFLEESTNTVKAKRNLGKVVLLSTYFIVWLVAMFVFWQIRYVPEGFNITLRWAILPLLLLILSVIVGKNNYWGKGNWLCVAGAAITFLTVPYIGYVEEADTLTYAFCFPNPMYMLVGIVISVLGILIGNWWRIK